MNKKWISFLLIICSLFARPGYGQDDVQYWSWYTLDIYENKYLKFMNHSQLRFAEDISDFNLWFTSQRVKVKAHKNFHLGLNYTYLENEVKSPQKSEFKSQHRLELEATPRFKLNSHWALENRNRWEFRWIEDKGSDNARFRHKWQLTYQVNQFEWWDSVYGSNEFFVNFSKRQIDENRFVPLGAQFALSSNLKLGFFYMMRSGKRQKWRTDHVVGSHFKVIF